MGKLIYRIPGLRLLISSLPGLALRSLVESLGKPLDALPGKFDIKRHSPSILHVCARTFAARIHNVRIKMKNQTI